MRIISSLSKALRNMIVPAVLIGASPLHAEGAVTVPLDEESAALRIKGPKGMKTEFLPERVIRFTYSLTEAKKGAVSLIFEPSPATPANMMYFEMKQAQAEKLATSVVLQSGKMLVKKLDGLGPDWNSYSVDLATLASDAKTNLEPVAGARISFHANALIGEQTAELRNWRLE